MSSINWLLRVFKKTAYEKGIKSKTNSKNPYKKFTNNWFSWNKGFNEK